MRLLEGILEVDLADDNAQSEVRKDHRQRSQTRLVAMGNIEASQEDDKEHTMACKTTGCEVEEALERWLEELSAILRWEAHCLLGVQFWGSEKLQYHQASHSQSAA